MALENLLPQNVLVELNSILKNRKITNQQLAAFLAQCSHESGGFTLTAENLNYSAKGLLKTFGKYFNESNVNNYARQPEKIANKVYANRMGNGSELSGDGWKYRGRGYCQVTGKASYQNFDATVTDDITNNPDLVATKYPLQSSFWYFDSNKLWGISDFKTLTKRINGGLNGYDERLKLYNKFLSAV